MVEEVHSLSIKFSTIRDRSNMCHGKLYPIFNLPQAVEFNLLRIYFTEILKYFDFLSSSYLILGKFTQELNEICLLLVYTLQKLFRSFLPNNLQKHFNYRATINLRKENIGNVRDLVDFLSVLVEGTRISFNTSLKNYTIIFSC